ncbi:AbiH family protein [Mogibacterium diversum]
MKTLFIIGNGFDLAHKLPTKFDPDFKEIAKEYEYKNFWELYQTEENEIWSDFERLLAYPDFNNLLDIFDGLGPDYLSDNESDRDSIITEVKINGNLTRALDEFAKNAEKALSNVKPLDFFSSMLDKKDIFINFNYTHTLEHIYKIPKENILHIHGEVGKNNLILGYPSGSYSPEKFYVDRSGKGRDYTSVNFEDYIQEIDDFYVQTAYIDLIEKTKSFKKDYQMALINSFLNSYKKDINKIVIYGHSCSIDFPYFEFLKKRYENTPWCFFIKEDEDCFQNQAVKELVTKLSIDSPEIKIAI